MLLILLILALLITLFFFLISPTVRRHADRDLLDGIVVAHRGLHDLREDTPENSMPAFVEALGRGYAIENDIHITADGQVVVFHDSSLKRMCGVEGTIEEMTLAEIRRLRLANTECQIPTLQECLDLVDGQVPLLIEFKSETAEVCERLCPAADAILSRYRGKYVIHSFDPRVLKWYRKNRKEIRRGQLAYYEKGTPLSHRLIGLMLLNFLGRPDFINYKFEERNNVMRRLVIFLGAHPAGWTFRSQEELNRCRDDFKTFTFENFIPKERVL